MIMGYTMCMMNKRAKQPPVPSERRETVRQEIMDVLKGQTLTAKDISALVRIPEKSVYEHLEHIQKSMARSEHPLAVVPAQCKKCGFTFKKRERLKKPGRCPACKGEAIEEPLFSITEDREQI